MIEYPPEDFFMTVAEWKLDELKEFEQSPIADSPFNFTQWMVFRELNAVTDLAKYMDEQHSKRWVPYPILSLNNQTHAKGEVHRHQNFSVGTLLMSMKHTFSQSWLGVF